MATQRNVSKPEEDTQLHLEEAKARGYEIPNFTIKEIRDAIPAHCFQRDTFTSFTHVFHDVAIIAALFWAATYIDTVPNFYVRIMLWPLYWICQGIVGTGIWVLGHECGHQAFSPSKTINDSVGFVLHTFLLVPYYSWKYSHSKHHKATGHLTNDQVFVPSTRSSYGLPPREQDPIPDGPHSAIEESPIFTLYQMFIMCYFGFPAYLIYNVSGQKYPGYASHFNPHFVIYDKNQFWDIVVSALGIFAMFAGMFYFASIYGALNVIRYYVLPYFNVNLWLVLITYLQHTHPDLPHYSDKVWNFQRGAALTIDRSYGKILNYFHHHISDTHVAHHFFSTMPFYHAEEATRHIKKALGKFYVYDDTPIAIAFWRARRDCRFVEDEGDVVFYKK